MVVSLDIAPLPLLLPYCNSLFFCGFSEDPTSTRNTTGLLSTGQI